MPVAHQAVSILDPNSVAAIRARVAAGKVPWAGPLLLVVTRSCVWMASLGAVALIFLARHSARPWHQACYWWSVCFTSADIVCILAMRHYTRREGIRLRDLLGPIRLRWGRDIFLGLGCYLIIFPFHMAGGYSSQRFFYAAQPNPADFIVHSHALPLWATIYSLAVMWVVNAPVEEMTYQAYVLPRLQALTGRAWIAVSVVAFFWAAQHCALGFTPDLRSLACRFCAFLPGTLVAIAIYVRVRRLAPLIVAHWLMDLGAVLMTAIY